MVKKKVDSNFTLNGREFDSDLLTFEQQKLLVKLLFCRNKVNSLDTELEELTQEIKEIEDDLERYVLSSFV